jgi:hypothetical protein
MSALLGSPNLIYLVGPPSYIQCPHYHSWRVEPLVNLGVYCRPINDKDQMLKVCFSGIYV